MQSDKNNLIKCEKCNKFETFELDMEYPHLIVGELDNGIACVHNVITGENFFDSKTIEKVTGLARSTVSDNISRYYEFFNKSGYPDLLGDSSNLKKDNKLTLKVKNIKKPVIFHSFNVLTYVSFHSTKPEAVIMRNWIENALNEKFNRDNNIDLVNMEAKNERLRNKLKHDSQMISGLEYQYDVLLKDGDKENAEIIVDALKIYKRERKEMGSLVDMVDNWISKEKMRRPALNDIKNNKYWKGKYDGMISPPTGQYDRNHNLLIPIKKRGGFNE